MSSKNSLQEYCQKRQMPLPLYSVWQTADNMFQASVNLEDMVFWSGHCRRKKDAELDAAARALGAIEAKPVPTQTVEVSEGNYLIIDLENVGPKRANEMLAKYRGINIYVFASKNHPTWNKFAAEHVTRIETIPGRRDGADVQIAFHMGYLVHEVPPSSHFIIWTADHFGFALAECIRAHGHTSECTNEPCF
ncbi:hypothetical protein KDA11_05110 [Candidatus Saccharibacteria bacterium]|nr:hypothetical protein [Candidatus Saccharibacteria bacterium]